MTDNPAGTTEIHDRITQAYRGEFGEDFMEATRRRIHWICGHSQGARVLDIGCSQGITAILLARKGYQVTGIDIDSKAIAEAEAYLAAEPEEMRERVAFVHGDAADLPTEAPYTTVILGEVLEHLADPEQLVTVAARHLLPGGRLVVTVPFGINGWPDHRQTFYLGSPYRLISRHFEIGAVEILDRWIGFTGTRRSQPEAAPSDAIRPDLLEMLESGFQTLERTLRNEFTTLRKRAVALEKRNQALGREIEELRSVHEERDRLAEERDRLAEERERLLAEAAQTHRQQLQQLHTQRQLKHEADELRSSVSFRLGHALVLGFQSPRRLLDLPSDVTRLYREGRAKHARHAYVGDGADERYGRLTAEECERLEAIYRDGGADAVAAEILSRYPDDRDAGARALLAAGKALTDAGHREVGLPLASAAARHSHNDQTLRALFWAASHEGDFRTAGRCFAEIKDILGAEPSTTQLRWLEKLQRSPAHVVSAATHIPPRAARAENPHDRRLCYVLHNSLPYSSGGYATRAHGLAAGLRNAGWEVVALARPGFPLDTKPELRPGDVPLQEELDGIEYRFLLEPERHSLSRRDYMLVAADRIEAALRDIRPEVVVAASAHLSALPALIAAHRLGIPFAYEVRGFWEVTRQSRKPELVGTLGYRVDVALETIVAQEADHVFTLTEPMREELVARGVDTPITLLPNSCDPDRFTPRPRDEALVTRLGIPPGVPVIGYVGTFVQYEGLEHLAEACARLAGRSIDFRLLLVGNEDTSGTGRGPVTTDILEVAVRTGLAPRLIMPGRVPHEEVEAYYSLIDIAPFPRKPQPVTEMVSPMKLLEALAMEKAVVVSSVRALTEMIRHDETGLVFEKGSVDRLADTLARLIAEPDLRRRLGRDARAWVVRERTWDATARLAVDELERLRAPQPALARVE